MKLGNFSVSLAVKDLAASRAFYEKLGFRPVGGNGKSWLILRNDSAKIGLFQGMFPKNTPTFSPGWDSGAKTLADFDGTMLFVSHDRTFLRGLASKVLDLSGGGEGTARQPLIFQSSYEKWVERTGHEAPGVHR